MAEGLLHLVFSPSGLSVLPSRVGAGDCVVLLGGSRLMDVPGWPSGVQVVTLTDSTVALSGPGYIDHREFVALTLSYSRIVSW